MRTPKWQWAIFAMFLAKPALADTFSFSTGIPDGKMAAATRPSSAGKFEIETGDDFALTSETLINSATFTGLLSGGTSIGEVVVEIYRVFPNDSDVGRTSGPPIFRRPRFRPGSTRLRTWNSPIGTLLQATSHLPLQC